VTGTLLVAGLAVWAAGAAVALVLGTGRTAGRILPFVAGVGGSGVVTAAGVLAVFARAETIDIGGVIGLGHTLVRLDPLAGAFLTLTAGLGICLSACLVSWSRPVGRLPSRGAAAGYLLLLGSTTVVVIAGDAFTFLFGWESLTVAFIILTGVARGSRVGARGSWLTGAFGKASGVALLLGFLLLAGRRHDLALASWSVLRSGALRDGAYALVIAGFGAKVGLAPFEVWLPAGYPAAPGPTRAAMAGLAANAGFYGLWRFLGILDAPPQWLVILVLVLGGLTALLGIAFAAVESRLDRVIAFSSVENAGVILVGYGVAMTGLAVHRVDLAAAGLLAASLQVLAHAVAKSSLFASAAFFQADLGTDDIERLHGVGRHHPVSATAFGVGSLTLAGLPPTIGFVSEWMVLEALMQEFRVHPLGLKLALAAAGALVALTAGLAALTFARLIGLMLRGGAPRRPPPGRVLDGGGAGRPALVTLAAACLAFAGVAPWVIRFVATGLAPVLPSAAVRGALRAPWTIQPVYAGFSSLSPSWLWVTMPLGLVAVAGATLALSSGRLLRTRRVPAWRSAADPVDGPTHYSAFGYANALRHVLGNVLGTRQETAPVANGDWQTGPGPDARTAGPRLVVLTTVVEPVAAYLWRPLRRLVLAAAALVRRLQSGRLEAYIGYMLVALVAVLALVAATR
jgi:hydrogenase-4 component B